MRAARLLVGGLVALAPLGAAADAAVLTFNELSSSGWQGTQVASDYAPPELSGTGITTTWSGWYVGYMGGTLRDGTYIQTKNGTSTPGVITFNQGVDVSSIWVDTEWGVGPGMTIRAFTDADDTTPVLTYTRPNDQGRGANSPTNWVNVTTFAGTSIEKLEFSNGGSWPAYFADSITVSPVPEPASLALLGIGGVALLVRRRA